jgi:hypothetical protein
MHMDRAIFDLRASVEATSLYIIICSLLDDGAPAILDNIRSRWSGSEEGLAGAIDELNRCRVVEAQSPLSEAEAIRLRPRSDWRCA